MIVFKSMCDKCYRMLGDNEQIFALKLIDDENIERVYKGHKECLDDMVMILGQLYGIGEKKQDEQI